jgi:AcrR family transcriptional regulator
LNTRDRLKQIGLSLFARHGYEGTTLAQIATAASIKKPSIYNHFDSKAALFLELSRDADNDMIALIDASLADMADAPFEQRLRHLLQQCATFAYREHQGVFYKRFLLFPRWTSSPKPRPSPSRANPGSIGVCSNSCRRVAESAHYGRRWPTTTSLPRSIASSTACFQRRSCTKSASWSAGSKVFGRCSGWGSRLADQTG